MVGGLGAEGVLAKRHLNFELGGQGGENSDKMERGLFFCRSRLQQFCVSRIVIPECV